jgi:glucan biosynthesis protein C
MAQNENYNHILFLDNLRYLLVLLVVVLHATFAYSKFVPWWCVKELSDSTVIFDTLLLLLNIFLMPSLFFIAGYFATPSYLKNGASVFISKKIKRLGLPLLIAIPIISPTFSYIYSFKSIEISAAAFWANYMDSALNFDVKIMDWTSHFNHAHLWFLSLLLFFFVIYVVIAKLKATIGENNNTSTRKATKTFNPIVLFALVTFLSAVSTGIAKIIFPNTSGSAPWVSIGNLLIFDPSRIVSYALYFAMGVYAYQKKWFFDIKIPGSSTQWFVLCILSSVSFVFILNTLIAKPSFVVSILFLISKSLLCIFYLSTMLILAHNYWNSPSRLNQLLAANSYNIYILHLLILIIIQLLLKNWAEGFLFIKFCVVSIATIFLSYTLSQYALRSYPRLTVMGIYAIFITLLIIR